MFETRGVCMLIQTFLTAGAIWVSLQMQGNPVIGWQNIPCCLEGGEGRFVYETQGKDLEEETSINPAKVCVFVRRHTVCFTRLQGPIWWADRVSSSPWPRSKWEAKGPVGLATTVDWRVQHSRPFAMRVSMWTTSDSLSSPITALEKSRRRRRRRYREQQKDWKEKGKMRKR